MTNKNQEAEHIEGEAMNSAEGFIIKNINKFLTAVLAVVVVIVGIIAYTNYVVEPKEAKAQEALYPSQNYFMQQQFKLALDGDSISSIGLVAITKKYGSTPAGNLAHAYAGICYKKLGQNDKAIKELEAFDADDKQIAPAILAATANCYADAGQTEKAAGMLVDAADRANAATLSPIYLLNAGQLYQAAKQYDKAIATYEQIKKEYPNSQLGRGIERYIELAKAQAGV